MKLKCRDQNGKCQNIGTKSAFSPCVKLLGGVWKNVFCCLKTCVEIYMDEKVYENACNVI